LPLTRATFRGILVRVHEEFFLVPTTHVERVVRLDPEKIQVVANREMIQLQGHSVSLVRLGDVLELPCEHRGSTQLDKPYVIVLRLAEKRLACLIDEVLDEQEVLVKTLGKQLSRVRNIAGVTLLGDGKVVPILNVPDLMKSAVRMAGTAPLRLTAGRAER